MRSAKPEISELTVAKWQRMVDLIADLAKVPASLIMNTTGAHHAVYVANRSDAHPYTVGQAFDLNEKLYCFGVLQNDGELCVEDALCDPRWHDNQDLDHGMTFYIGLPVKWPDGTVFGTICVLDRRRNKRALVFRTGLEEFSRIVEDDLALLVEIDQRKQAQAARTGQPRNDNPAAYARHRGCKHRPAGSAEWRRSIKNRSRNAYSEADHGACHAPCQQVAAPVGR
jgi:c-di-GMP phosphodiesterase